MTKAEEVLLYKYVLQIKLQVLQYIEKTHNGD